MTRKFSNPRAVARRRHGRLHASLLNRFARDTGGAAVVLAAVLFPVVIGGMGLGAETGYWYLSQRKLQHAADVSAHAGGTRNRAGDTRTAVEAAALNIATKSGFDAATGSLAVHVPPTSGALAGEANAVEVVATRTMPRLFSSIFSDEPVVLRARAVVQVSGGSKACTTARVAARW